MNKKFTWSTYNWETKALIKLGKECGLVYDGWDKENGLPEWIGTDSQFSLYEASAVECGLL